MKAAGRTLTVGELRTEIEGLADNAPVYLGHIVGGVGYPIGQIDTDGATGGLVLVPDPQ